MVQTAFVTSVHLKTMCEQDDEDEQLARAIAASLGQGVQSAASTTPAPALATQPAAAAAAAAASAPRQPQPGPREGERADVAASSLGTFVRKGDDIRAALKFCNDRWLDWHSSPVYSSYIFCLGIGAKWFQNDFTVLQLA